MRYAIPVFLILITAFSMGCVTTQEQTLLQQRLAMLEQRVGELEKKVQNTEEERKAKADLMARLDNLQLQMGRMEGRLQELEHKIEKGQMPVTTSPVIARPPEPARQETPSMSPEEALYSEALKAFQQKNYSLSEEKFKQFADNYPDSSLADNAFFWLGEIYFIRGNYLKAIEYYQQVIDKYPKGNKVASSLYKQAKAWEALGDRTAARILYEKVIEKAPNSAEARLAKEALESLKKSPQ
ncbi:tol-pal system protein YbgF [Thermodesulforhabdus norvegica]|uniref:Tol-pal system protein YbgF n=1 Tax=Thermodesulforhabdus norvegica TaxID=39841 RepID=A0A1I4TEN8_9BACT|nr:tol-pal system protein YbgF [Thermodesulforhabdus norvegica]SFM75037.1 tol-pal system protein YbgF [Thermodesulforhabdus norvegica]